MPIAIDSTSSSTYEAALSTYNWTHTCTGRDRILIVGVSILISGSVNSITYNSVNLIKIRRDAGAVYSSELWYLVAPSLGTNSIVVTLSTSLTSVAGAASYNGVSQLATIGVVGGATGSNNPATVDVTTKGTNSLVIDVVAAQTGTVIVGSGNTSRWNNAGALGSGAGADKTVASPATVTMQWTNIGVTDSWAITAAEITPSITDNIFGLGSPATSIGVKNTVTSY